MKILAHSITFPWKRQEPFNTDILRKKRCLSYLPLYLYLLVRKVILPSQPGTNTESGRLASRGQDRGLARNPDYFMLLLEVTEVESVVNPEQFSGCFFSLPQKNSSGSKPYP